MAFPQVSSSATSTDTVSDTSHVVSLPASIASGDLLIIAHCGSATDGTPNTAATGWTVLKELVGLFAVFHMAVLYRIADGSEGATVTLTTDTAELSAALALRITGWHGTTPPEASTGAKGTNDNSAPDPDSLTASWGAEDNLWIALACVDASPATFTAYPTNYADNNLVSANSGQAVVGAATQEVAAATEDPGSFTKSVNAQWNALTIAVRPAAGGGGSVTIPVLMHNYRRRRAV